ncbi:MULTISPECIES: hypothetical protein [unclassified Sphingomonas]|jgi:hypothetical protein|nr:hypothetical protein [Sphingomonas sp. FARSPH]
MAPLLLLRAVPALNRDMPQSRIRDRGVRVLGGDAIADVYRVFWR